jgi:hypothetical protein
MKRDYSVYSDEMLEVVEITTRQVLEETQHELIRIKQEKLVRSEKPLTSKQLALRMNVEHADVCDHIRKIGVLAEEQYEDGELDHYLLRPPAVLLVVSSFDPHLPV